MNALLRFCRALVVTTVALGLGSPGFLQIANAQGIPSAGLMATPAAQGRFTTEDSGSLAMIGPGGKVEGKCPLKHTDVSADISGYIARVTVTQKFHNPSTKKIEAIYTFPLSESGAVDEMVMTVGKRTIKGSIKKREEAKQIYEEAKARGHVASLLDQERPNIFTQHVANIEPGAEVSITLKYVDLIPFEAGSFSFVFPTVVGPRFIPGNPFGQIGPGTVPITTIVPDAPKITPPITPEGTRAGHDISIKVNVHSPLPIASIDSKLHAITVDKKSATTAKIELQQKATIPNKDFVLNWDVAGDSLQSGYLTNAKNGSGYFTIMMVPPKKVKSSAVNPKEMVFLIDCSGSQRGLPIRKSAETITYVIDHMNINDTFQVISFNNTYKTLFDKARPASPENRKEAIEYLRGVEGNGGTWMGPAVENILKMPPPDNRLRVVVFMTDGYVGNDYEIAGMIRKYKDSARWFPFGVGNAVNRSLLENIAKEGGGESDYVLLNSSAEAVGKKFYDRVASPLLTNAKVDFGTLPVKDTYPREFSDVWAQRPLYITGRYLKPGKGTVTISGISGGKPYQQKLEVDLPENNPANPVIGSVWARKQVDRLMAEDYAGAQSGNFNKELRTEIERIALEHHIVSQFTSFVAVEETTVTKGGKAETVEVPVEMPEGVSYEGIYGNEGASGPIHTATNMGKSIGQGYRYQNSGSSRAFRSAALPKGTIRNMISSPAPTALFSSGGGGGGSGATLPRTNLGSYVASGGDKARTGMVPPPASIPSGSPAASAYKHYAPGAHAVRPSGSLMASPAYPGSGVAQSEAEIPQKEGIDDKSIALPSFEETDESKKLTPSLIALLKKEKIEKDGTTDGIAVKDGRVTVKIKLKAVNDEIVARLKAIGVVVKSSSANEITAELPVLWILRVAALDEVVSIGI